MGNAMPEVSASLISEAAERIRAGGIVAFPTETFYGLAVDPFNSEAIERLFFLKKRSHEKPLLVLIGSRNDLGLLVSRIPRQYQKLINAFWPGPLTMVFDGLDGLPELLTDERGTVGVRQSSHPVARELAMAAGGVITGTSANLSGLPAPVSRTEVAAMFPEGIDLIVDGGSVPGGLGSTIIGLERENVKLIRQGRVSMDDVRQAISC